MSTTPQNDLMIDAMGRDLVRLSEAYLEDDVDQARRITKRLITSLTDLYANRPGCLASDLETGPS